MVGGLVEDQELRRPLGHQHAGERRAQAFAAAQGPDALVGRHIAEQEARQGRAGGVFRGRGVQATEGLNQRLVLAQEGRLLIEKGGGAVARDPAAGRFQLGGR